MTRDAEPTRPPQSSSRRLPLIVGFTLVSAGMALVGGLALQQPPAYTPPTPQEGGELDRRARAFERSFATQFTLIRETDEPWAIRVRESDLNAWIWIRLPHWIAHVHGSGAPGSSPGLQASLDPGRIRLINDSFVLSFRPGVEDGWTRLQPGPGSYLGRLPIPGGLLELLSSSMGLEGIGAVLTGSTGGDGAGGTRAGRGGTPGGICFETRFPLGDGRVVELLEVRPEERQLVMVFRTGT